MKLNNTTSSGTTRPHWVSSVADGGTSKSQSSRRKLYVLLTFWIVLLTMAMAAAHAGKDSDGNAGGTSAQVPEAFKKPADSLVANTENGGAKRLQISTDGLNDDMPSAFRNTQRNEIVHTEWLSPVATILAEQQRPLRILHLGDSHVAGKTFPLAVKAVLTQKLGTAESADEGTGVFFKFIGSNGATSQRFLTGDYMQQISQLRPDLIILSLGTNEAHGMGYREDTHCNQLDAFFNKLQAACPEATVLLTTPPGDYLTTTYVNYRRTSRSSRKKVRHVQRSMRPNPMCMRCAANLLNYGNENRMAVWDMHTICGGNVAERNWTSAHLMRPDRIHYQPDGYNLQGRLLGNAIVRALASIDL